jgi:hypothetical protein
MRSVEEISGSMKSAEDCAARSIRMSLTAGFGSF